MSYVILLGATVVWLFSWAAGWISPWWPLAACGSLVLLLTYRYGYRRSCR